MTYFRRWRKIRQTEKIISLERTRFSITACWNRSVFGRFYHSRSLRIRQGRRSWETLWYLKIRPLLWMLSRSTSVIPSGVPTTAHIGPAGLRVLSKVSSGIISQLLAMGRESVSDSILPIRSSKPWSITCSASIEFLSCRCKLSKETSRLTKPAGLHCMMLI